MPPPANPTPLSDAEIERLIADAEAANQLPDIPVAWMNGYDTDVHNRHFANMANLTPAVAIPLLRELLERRAECARLRGSLTRMIEDFPAYEGAPDAAYEYVEMAKQALDEGEQTR